MVVLGISQEVPVKGPVWARGKKKKKKNLTVNVEDRRWREPVEILKDMGIITGSCFVEVRIPLAVTMVSSCVPSLDPDMIVVAGHVQSISFKVRKKAVMNHFFRPGLFLVQLIVSRVPCASRFEFLFGVLDLGRQ